MPNVLRQGDNCQGHGCFPSRPSVQGSANVFTNNIPTHLQSHAYATHCCPAIPACHGAVLASGSSTVYVNNLQIGRVNDPTSCGSAAGSNSSPNVFAGG